MHSTPLTTQPALEARNVSRRFGQTDALKDASIAIAHGEFVAVIGQSGSGKSTLLRVLAGLEGIDAGEVFEAGSRVASPGATIPAEQRRIGLVFQDFALFPHLSAADNVGFGLRKLPRAERDARIARWLDVVDLSNKAARFPHQLSGGEQQRVALARALAPQPSALLLDEPFSGLDPSLRDEMQERTITTLKESGTAALLVSHDTEEALAIADRVAVMEAGTIMQTGQPDWVHANPVSLSVARALGPVWTLPGRADGKSATTMLGDFATTLSGACILAGRPDATAIHTDPDGDFTVKALRGVGQHVRLRLEDGAGHVLWSELHRSEAPETGTRVRAELLKPLVFKA